MGWILRGAVCTAALTGAVAAAGPVHADDGSYLATLDAQGVFRSGPPNARLSAGHKVCADLRGGLSPDEVVARYRTLPTFGAPSMIDDLRGSLRPLIAIAQRELCPDTLG